ncbi:hypothetical protein [Flammeovirga sp. SJP92]|uniref:hypothetical protein n=1 Tax=Flammeovirga sp. SJP92 TaxID=1775430 RepID=UPI00078955D8|nr:hypothetical protein [Flammeovirga sp. SJP92]KXX66559.1 hypothetical protein AVL50_31575 [Flammeovirga sp. SJP92]
MKRDYNITTTARLKGYTHYFGFLLLTKFLGVTADQYERLMGNYENLTFETIFQITYLPLSFLEQLVLIIGMLSIFIKHKFSFLVMNIPPYLFIVGGIYILLNRHDGSGGIDHGIFGLFCIILSNTLSVLKRYNLKKHSKYQLFLNIGSLFISCLILFFCVSFDWI